MEVQRIEASLAEDDLARIVEMYGRVFTLPPFSESRDDVSEFGGRLARHATYKGFTGYKALAGEEAVGFAYGFRYLDGGWTDRVLRSELSDHQRDYWTQDCFELVELAVVPGARGGGVGRLLYDRLMEVHRHRTALLFTLEEDTVAAGMYRRRGWRTLARGLHFSENDSPVRLMGLRPGSESPDL